MEVRGGRGGARTRMNGQKAAGIGSYCLPCLEFQGKLTEETQASIDAIERSQFNLCIDLSLSIFTALLDV